MNKTLLEINNIVFGYKENEILQDISLKLASGEILGIIGPNGSGKSTLIKIISGVIYPWSGEVLVKNRPLVSYSRRSFAKMVSCVSQETDTDFPFTVRELVAMGRTPYLGRFSIEKKRDKEVVKDAMDLTGISSYANRFPCELSGGERHRVIIARALAQEPDILLLDEPTAHLDLHHQVEINSLIMKLKREKRVGIIYVTHDINSAALCCDRIAVIRCGKIHVEGPPLQIITAENIQQVYGCEVLVDINPQTAMPRVTPFMERLN